MHRFGKRDIDLKFEIAAGLGAAVVARLRGSGAAEKLAEKIAEARSARAALRSGAEIEAAEIEMNVFRRSSPPYPAPGGGMPPGPGTLKPNWSYIWRFFVSERTS